MLVTLGKFLKLFMFRTHLAKFLSSFYSVLILLSFLSFWFKTHLAKFLKFFVFKIHLAKFLKLFVQDWFGKVSQAFCSGLIWQSSSSFMFMTDLAKFFKLFVQEWFGKFLQAFCSKLIWQISSNFLFKTDLANFFKLFVHDWSSKWYYHPHCTEEEIQAASSTFAKNSTTSHSIRKHLQRAEENSVCVKFFALFKTLCRSTCISIEWASLSSWES